MNLALIQGLVTGLGADRLNPVLDPGPKHSWQLATPPEWPWTPCARLRA